MPIKYNHLSMLKTVLQSVFNRTNGIGKNSTVVNGVVVLLSLLWIYMGASSVSYMALPEYLHGGIVMMLWILCLPTVSAKNHQKHVRTTMAILKLATVASVLWLGFGTPMAGLLFLGNYVWNQYHGEQSEHNIQNVSYTMLIVCVSVLMFMPVLFMNIQSKSIQNISSGKNELSSWDKTIAKIFPEYQIAEKIMPPLVHALHDKTLPLNNISQSYDYVVWCSNKNELMLTTNAVIANRSYTLRTPVNGDNSCQYNVLYPELDMGKTMLAMATKNKEYTSANLDSYMSVNHFGLNGRRVEADALSSSTAQKLTHAIIESNRQLVNASHH